MPTPFTFEERQKIPVDLINAGMALTEELGLKKMTVAAVAKKAGVATGTFYSFFLSKERFVTEMLKYAEFQNLTLLDIELKCGPKMNLKEFLRSFRECFRYENNFMLRLTVEDWVWYKSHTHDDTFLSNESELDRLYTVLEQVEGVRKDIDTGVVINFIKSIYSMFQNRATFFESALETNVDLIFEVIYRYMSAEK